MLSWCNRDRFFVCGHCIPECKRLHGVTRNSVATPAIAAAFMVSFLFASFAPSVAPLAYEFSTLNAYRAMPQTSIQAAPSGQAVKISGTIASESTYAYPVALSGHEQLGKGCSWNWDEGAQFTVGDGSGVIPVSRGFCRDHGGRNGRPLRSQIPTSLNHQSGLLPSNPESSRLDHCGAVRHPLRWTLGADCNRQPT